MGRPWGGMGARRSGGMRDAKKGDGLAAHPPELCGGRAVPGWGQFIPRSSISIDAPSRIARYRVILEPGRCHPASQSSANGS